MPSEILSTEYEVRCADGQVSYRTERHGEQTEAEEKARWADTHSATHCGPHYVVAVTTEVHSVKVWPDDE